MLSEIVLCVLGIFVARGDVFGVAKCAFLVLRTFELGL